MNLIVDSLAYWLADFYLAATVLLVAALVAMKACSQPAKRLAVAKAAIVAAALLATLCALPGWSVVSLRGVDTREAAVVTPVAALPAVTPTSELPRFEEAAPIAPATATLSRPEAAEVKWNWSIPWLKLLVTGFFIGCAAVVLWLVAGVAAATRLVRRAERFPDPLRDALRDVDGVGELLVSREIDVPVALGVFRPRVILPREWIEMRSARELSTVLAHEAAHIRNGDLRWLAASRLVLVVLWAQPLYWWLRRQMRLDQETLADAAAAEVAGRRAYAEQLVAWARDVVARPRPLLPASVGLWEGASQLRQRVAVLLDGRFAISPKTTASWASGALGVATVLAVLLSFMSFAPLGRSDAASVQKTAAEIESTIQQSLRTYPRVALGSGPLAINGRCVDEDGKPFDSAHVALLYFNINQSTYGLVEIEKVDPQGEFQFRGLELPTEEDDGQVTYWLAAWSPGRASGVTNFIPELPRRIAFTLSPAEAVSGSVRDEEGNPVAGALVRFDHFPFPAIEGICCSRTDANGDFAVVDLARLRPESLVKELGGGLREVRYCAFDVEHSRFANASVQYEQVPRKIDVVLKPPSVIRGRVVYETAKRPAARARVMLQNVDYQDQNLKDPPTYWADATTDGAGRFALKNLRPGKYNVWASADDWTTVALDSFQVGAGEERTAPDIELVKGGFLTGRLVDADTGENVSIGKDDGYVSVGVHGPSRPRSGAAIEGARVNADGTFRFRLPPGEHYVYLSGVGPYTVEGDERGARNVTIRDGKTSDTKFRVRRAEGDSSASIESDGLDQKKALASEASQGNEVEAVKTSATQHLSIGGGTVNSFVAGYPATPWDYEPNAVRLEVEDEAGEPVAGVEATLFRVSQATGEREQVRAVAGDEEGVVEFRDVVAADAAREFQEKLAAGEFPGSVRDVFYIVLKKPRLGTVILPVSDFTVASRGSKRRVRMRPAAELTGRVTDAEGKPVSGARVAVGALGGVFALDGANATTSDSKGEFHLANLNEFDRGAAMMRATERGRDVLAVTEKREADYPAIYDPAENFAASDLVATHPDFAVTRVEGGNIPGEASVVMKPAAAIEGRVVEFETGKPAAGVLVKAVGQNLEQDSDVVSLVAGSSAPLFAGSSHSATTRTDDEGRYRLSSLPAGTYDVWVEPQSNDWSTTAWVSRGVTGIRAEAGKSAAVAPELTTGPGATIRGRLIDATTGKAPELGTDGASVQASFLLGEPQSLQVLPMERVAVGPDGEFPLRVVPGALRVMLIVSKTGDRLGSPGNYRSDDDVWKTGQLFDLEHGESVDASFRVWPWSVVESLRSEVVRGFELLNAGKLTEASAAFSDVIAKDAKNTAALQGRAQAYEASGQLTEAIADTERLLELEPNDMILLNNLAHLLATSPNEADRDGARAVELAQRAFAQAEAAKLQGAARAELLDTLAAAQAEAGDFVAAVKTQREAMEKAGDGKRSEMRKRLEAFEAGKAWRREASVSVAK